MPKVINLSGRKPRVVHEGAVYIGRASPRSGLRASKWANPFMIERDGARDEVIDMYERWLRDGARSDGGIARIARQGFRVLVRAACDHGDVLLRLANAAS
jgi:hypothetical protein